MYTIGINHAYRLNSSFIALDPEARTELLQLIKETGGTKIGLEEIGTRQLDIKPPGNEEPLTENQGWTSNKKYLHPPTCISLRYCGTY
jgi:hypothetical protein